jgi:hypothetical protein
MHQLHDYNVHIDSNDVFWMVPVEHDAVEVEFDEARARLRVDNLRVFDDHDLANSLTLGLGLPDDPRSPFPAIEPKAPVRATFSFDVEWSGIVDRAEIRNDTQQFRGTFYSTGATIKWSVEQLGFRFESDTQQNLISVLGREQNGGFFT